MLIRCSLSPLGKGSAAVLSDAVIIQSLCCSLLRLLRGSDFSSLVTKSLIYLNNFQLNFSLQSSQTFYVRGMISDLLLVVCIQLVFIRKHLN